MKKMYQTIKLRIETVHRLKRLKAEVGIGNLDALINIMIRVTNEHRLVLGNTGWNTNGETVEP